MYADRLRSQGEHKSALQSWSVEQRAVRIRRVYLTHVLKQNGIVFNAEIPMAQFENIC